MTVRPVLGIDIGGSGIKGAPVDLEVGDFATDRLRIPTPKKSTPKKVGAAVAEIVTHFADLIGDGPVGITIPAVVTHGVTRSAANIDKSWIGFEAQKMFEDLLGRHVLVVNDADAAGLAEAHFGAAKDHPGLVLLATLGTGIGTALVHRGVLIPNSEFGHVEIDGHDAETQASSGVKDRLGLSYKEWIPRIERYFQVVEALLWPDLIVVGGGISRDADKFLPKLRLQTAIVPAELRNRAGIIGAAWLAAHQDEDGVSDLTVEAATERALRHAAERTTLVRVADESDQVLPDDQAVLESAAEE
ncbi:polyphosphate--glucose phosphotransferase [Raineyella sp. LH-20]|uniref:polyphosphate--glucose phosphotransferase n=1 Tax=Raineyella sp. LH-20 TaxID=3081204 RepID=UPI002955203B|nr:ROK family protein [Raineyella sp. LH-20]WOP19881.1 ROK family protein [Raineyella sp. LH-20]